MRVGSVFIAYLQQPRPRTPQPTRNRRSAEVSLQCMSLVPGSAVRARACTKRLFAIVGGAEPGEPARPTLRVGADVGRGHHVLPQFDPPAPVALVADVALGALAGEVEL